MARRAKTVIGERELAQSQVMLRAGEQGIGAQQRATEGVTRESKAQQALGLQAGAQTAQQLQADLARGDVERGQELEREIATGREIQAEKGRKASLAAQGLEEAPGGMETPLMRRHRESLQGDVERGRAAEEALGDGGGQPQEARQPGQEPQATQLPSGAQAGPPTAEGVPPGIGPPPRMDVAGQAAAAPLETTRPGEIRPTRQAREALAFQRRGEAQERQMAQSELAIDRRNADANFREAEASYLDAQTKAGEQKLKQEEAAKEEMRTGMAHTRKLITDLTNRDVEPRRVALAFADNPDIQQAMAAGGEGPELQIAVARLLNSRLAMQNIRWAAVTGEALPDYGTNDLYQRFNMRQMEMTAAFRSNGVLTASAGQDPTLSEPFRGAARMQGAGVGGEQRQAWAGIRDFEEKEKFIRRATARAMMMADALSREGRAQMQATGMAEELAQANQRAAMAEQAMADMQALVGYGPTGDPGAGVTELEGGQRVPTDVAERTEQDIATRAAGGTPRPADRPQRERGGAGRWAWARDLPK